MHSTQHCSIFCYSCPESTRPNGAKAPQSLSAALPSFSALWASPNPKPTIMECVCMHRYNRARERASENHFTVISYLHRLHWFRHSQCQANMYVAIYTSRAMSNNYSPCYLFSFPFPKFHLSLQQFSSLPLSRVFTLFICKDALFLLQCKQNNALWSFLKGLQLSWAAWNPGRCNHSSSGMLEFQGQLV